MDRIRLIYIDRMKGLAILIVVLAHVYLISLDMRESLVFRFCSSFEIPLFMFVSGFVAYFSTTDMEQQQINRKFLKRFLSYVCPAFIISYCTTAYNYLFFGGRTPDLLNVLIGGAWYLKALAIFVCIHALLLKCKNLIWELLFIIIVEVLFLLGWKTSPFLLRFLCLEHCFFFFPFFMIGYYFRRYGLIEKLKSQNWIFTIALIGYICLLNADIEIRALSSLSERLVRPLFAILAITYLFASRESEDSRFERWLNNIGKRTLDIYVYHGILVLGTYSIVDMSFLKDNTIMLNNPWMILIIASLITLMLTYIAIWIGYIVRKSGLLTKVIYGQFFK